MPVPKNKPTTSSPDGSTTESLSRCHIECCVTKRREGAIPSPDEACGLFYYVPLHNVRYGVDGIATRAFLCYWRKLNFFNRSDGLTSTKSVGLMSLSVGIIYSSVTPNHLNRLIAHSIAA